MNIRFAIENDLQKIKNIDKHVSEDELLSMICKQRILIAENNDIFIGWLRWNLFWDIIPFMNMLFFFEEYRNHGYGTKMVEYWERLMRSFGHEMVMTSSQSNEDAQFFYRKLNYVDSGSLLLKDEPLEIIFTKRLN